MRPPSTPKRLCTDERGFTLIETLVAMVSAVVVVGALYAILDVAVSQTARVTDMVQATQIGRTTMTKLVDELHSACISSGFTPVQEKSNENKLIFINAYTKEAEITTAYKHEIVWEKGTGKLIEKRYTSSGGSWPTFTFPTTYTEIHLGENISKSTLSGKEVPIFQYFSYSKKSSSITSEESLSTLEKTALKGGSLEAGLSAKEAGEAAAVEISFRQAPLDKYAAEDRTVDFNNLITLGLSAPNAETPIEAKPCE